jgi:hypothetical protein
MIAERGKFTLKTQPMMRVSAILAVWMLMSILPCRCHADDSILDLQHNDLRPTAQAACMLMVKNDCCTRQQGWFLWGHSWGLEANVTVGPGGRQIKGDLVVETVHAIGRYQGDPLGLGPCGSYKPAFDRASIPGGNWYRHGVYVKGSGSYTIWIAKGQISASSYTFWDENKEDTHVACHCGPCCRGCKKNP